MKFEYLGEAAVAPASPALETNLVSDLLKAGTAVVQLISQQQLAKTNIKLAAAGQPTIPVSSVPGLTPTIQVQGGLDPQTRNMLLLGAAGLGAMFLLGRRKRR
jgi:hypothetical protein